MGFSFYSLSFLEGSSPIENSLFIDNIAGFRKNDNFLRIPYRGKVKRSVCPMDITFPLIEPSSTENERQHGFSDHNKD